MRIDKLEKDLEVAAHQHDLLQKNYKQQQNEIAGLKIDAERQREEHLKEITKLMN